MTYRRHRWSLDWNYAGDWQSTLLEAYGIEPDAVRIAYYRRRWDAPAVGGG